MRKNSQTISNCLFPAFEEQWIWDGSKSKKSNHDFIFNYLMEKMSSFGIVLPMLCFIGKAHLKESLIEL